MHSRFYNQSESAPLTERVAVVGVVILLHLAAFALWSLQPDMPTVPVNEISVSFDYMPMQHDNFAAQPKPKPREPESIPAEEAAVKEEVQAAAQNVSPPSQVMPDAEPDYRADYLNNPRPPYPMAARRLGNHGKVVLNVEVLGEGRAGQVLLHSSSGHQILDNAALQTVKTWRFAPARRFGQPVTRWFLVPVKFSLEDNET